MNVCVVYGCMYVWCACECGGRVCFVCVFTSEPIRVLAGYAPAAITHCSNKCMHVGSASCCIDDHLWDAALAERSYKSSNEPQHRILASWPREMASLCPPGICPCSHWYVCVCTRFSGRRTFPVAISTCKVTLQSGEGFILRETTHMPKLRRLTSRGMDVDYGEECLLVRVHG